MYIISAMHKYDFENSFSWAYACMDNGLFGSGMPCWTKSRREAVIFESVEKAKEWFNKNHDYLNFSEIKRNTLAIRKCIYKTVKVL